MNTHATNTHATLSHMESMRGASILEVVVATIILLTCVLGVVRMSIVAHQQARAGSFATDMWTVAQLQFEALRAERFDSLSAGTDTIRGYPVAWSVAGTEPKTVTLGVTRPNAIGGEAVDTFVMLVADWRGS